MDNSTSDNANTSEATQGKEGTKKRHYPKRAAAWNHFSEVREPSGKRIGRCNYCGKEYDVSSYKCGTSNMNTHLTKCDKYPANNHNSNQSNLTFSKSKVDGDEKVNLLAWKFDANACRRAITEMIITDELPFSFVENEGFRKCMKKCQPLFAIPSRSTMTRLSYQMYLDEKVKLKAEIKNSALRICLTTDTWTSIQRINYMCLTAHYIDSSWKLQKKVINFCPISSHKGSDIGRAVELCLLDWGFQNVFTVTVDNAKSNDTALEYLKTKFVKWGNGCVLNAKWSHVRCMAHVMNLVVQDGIKELSGPVNKIRGAVRYVRQSPARLKKFMEFAKLENVKSQKSLCLDVPTRWNSTYLMLSVAIEYERAFERLSLKDYNYRHVLEANDGPGVPDCLDWEDMRRLVGFLQHFYYLTVRVSGTRYVTSNNYVDSLSCIHNVLRECSFSTDIGLRDMAASMKLKFDKYWGDLENFNFLLFVASVFDPRNKFMYLEVNLCNMYGEEEGNRIKVICSNLLHELFNEYKRIHFSDHVKSVDSSSTPPRSSSSSSSSSFDACLFGTNSDAIKALREKTMAEVKRRKTESGIGNDMKSELDRYLTEEIEEDAEYYNSSDFKVLDWWKKRSPTFPILSHIARDILAIPISTVASESTFSTGGRVLDAFRSSLTPKTVQALICCQDWLRSGEVPINVEEKLEDLEKFEDDLNQFANDATVIDI